MSLLDDVSIVVTPNGYKAGTLYGVIPVPTEGSNQVINGDFATDSNWTTLGGWSISGGLANCNGGSIMFTNASIIATKIYKVTYTISGFVSGGVKIVINASPDVNGIIRTSNGTFTEYITSSSSPNGNFSFAAASSFVGSIDNVSVKEWVGSDMDVTRATAATRVDEDGLVNYAEVLGSEEVSDGDFLLTGTQAENTTGTYWTTGIGWTIANSKAECDGTQTTFSYLSQLGLGLSDKTYKIKFSVTISSGTLRPQFVGGTSGVSASDITSSGDYTIYIQPVDNTTFRFRANSSFVGDVSDISIKEADRDNVPRIDYSDGGCPHILVEPQRTNLVAYSEDFNQSYWTKTNSSVTSGVVSPDGNATAYKLVEDLNTSAHSLYRSNFSINTLRTFSVFAKAGEKERISIYDANKFGKFIGVIFNLTSGIVESNQDNSIYLNPKIELISNGWYKCSVTWQNSALQVPAFAPAILSTNVYTGDGVSGIYVYGAQAEEASYPTSYIPTSGSTVTRNQDIFTRDGISSLINSTEGVLFVEMAALSDDETNREITLSDGSVNNYVLIRFNSGGSNRIYTRVDVGGGIQYFNLDSSHTITDVNKIAIKWKNSDFCTFINGVKVDSQLSGSTFSANTLSELNFDNGSGTNNFFGKVKQLQVYKTALTDAQLTALTS